MIITDKEYGEFDVNLADDGTLDTVVQVYRLYSPKSFEFRFSQEYCTKFRDNNGMMLWGGFGQLAQEAVEAYIEQYLI